VIESALGRKSFEPLRYFGHKKKIKTSDFDPNLFRARVNSFNATAPKKRGQR
jgi:hypothetical protein